MTFGDRYKLKTSYLSSKSKYSCQHIRNFCRHLLVVYSVTIEVVYFIQKLLLTYAVLMCDYLKNHFVLLCRLIEKQEPEGATTRSLMMIMDIELYFFV